MNSVLVVDDEKNIRETLKDVLEDEGYDVVLAEDGKKAIELLKGRPFDVMLLDLWLPEIGGMDVLKMVREEYSNIQIIIISGHGTIDTAVKATKMGAFDFIEKPLSLERVLKIIDHAIKISGLKSENIQLKAASQKNYFMVKGASKLFLELEAIIDSCAESNTRILITGENGTGKEVVARKIHEKSGRKNESFVAVNCAAIPQTLIEAELFGYEKGAFTGAVKSKSGKFELAHQGTIFLDEIADMSLEAQSKVLRVLEELQFERVGGVSPIGVDVRVIAATNKDIEEEISSGAFREDLYYRLNVVPIHLSPLRERTEDIPPLIDYYLDFFARENNKKKKSISEEAFKFLTDVYNWPGNIRELKNLIERLSILTKNDTITLNDVKTHIPRIEENFSVNNTMSLKDAKESFEKAFISTSLRENGFNISKTADALKVERSNLYKLIKKLCIDLSR
jgi:two-component system nitrogen regulation response regulator NtrX